jgi:hypothetical protein
VQPTPAAIRCVQGLTSVALRLEAGQSPSLAYLRRVTRGSGEPAAADVAAAAARHRVAELLHSQADSLGLRSSFGEGLVTWLADVHANACRGVAVQLLEVSRVLGALDAYDVPALVLKGPALAMQSAGHGDARGFGDIDLFVAPGTVERALDILIDHGWRPRPFGSATPGTWAWRHIVRTFNEIPFDGVASTVDLHWRLDPTDGALPDFERSWETRALVEVMGVTLPTLDPADAFAHTCRHAAKDEWRWLRSLVDVHRLARMPEVWVDLERFEGRQVLGTLAVTERVLGLPDNVPPEVRRATLDQEAAVHRARVTQLKPARPRHPFPAAQSARDLRFRLRTSHDPRAVVRALAATAIPAYTVAGIEDRTAWTAVPRLILRRLRWLAAQLLTWVSASARDRRRPTTEHRVPERVQPSERAGT